MPSSFHRTVFALAMASGAAAPVSAMAGPLDAFLPKSGVIRGHIVEFAVAKEDQAISKQFRLAVQSNMDWFKHYVTANKPGEPLPYNPHMGVTEEQYDKLLHMKADIQDKGVIEIAVKRGPDGAVAFESADPAAATLKETRFSANEKAAETPFGPLPIFNEIHQNDVNAPFGVWNGAEWARVAEDGMDQPNVKLAFGKRAPSGDGVFYYQVSPTKDKPEQSLVVIYKLD